MNLYSLPIAFLLLLTASNAVSAGDPLSPNRLVFNNVEYPASDITGDGKIDIQDTLAGIDTNGVDAIVYVGADTAGELLNETVQGGNVIAPNHVAVDRIEDAATLAGILRVPLYLRGHFATTESIRIRESVSIFGYSQQPAVIHSLIPGGTVLFNIKQRVSNVRIENLTIKEVVDVSVAMILLSGKNENVRIEKVNIVGRHVGAIYSKAAGIYMFRDWIKNVRISNCKITDFQYGIHCVCGIRGLKILNNDFRRWNNFALRITRLAANDHLRTEDILIHGNDFRNPRSGLYRSVIFITRGETSMYIHNVRVNQNRIVSDGGAFRFGDSSSNTTGDQIVLHGVNDFQVSDNVVARGGENGITISNLSRNGVVSRNIIHSNDTHGIIVGSGYYELSVSSVASIRIGHKILGVESGAQATVRSVRVHPSDGRTILGIDKIVGGKIFREELIDNLTTGIQNVAFSSVVDRTKYVTLADNVVFGNGLDDANETPWTFGVLVLNADSVDLVRNQIFNPDYDAVLAVGGIQNQRKSVYLASSRNIFVASDNVFEFGDETINEGLGMNASSWVRE